MSLDKMQKLISSITKAAEDNQKIATPVLAIKLAKYQQEYPYDHTIGSMSRVIDKMASNNNLFINRKDLKDLYNRLYSRNTKFAQLFSEELGYEEVETKPTEIKRDDSSEVNVYEPADSILSNALNSVFDKTIPLKMYSQAAANKALKQINTKLDSINVKPTSLNVNDGNEKFLVLKADYETPKGITSFYVPVEVNESDIIESDIFITNAGMQDLNNKNVKKYVLENAGSKLNVTGALLLSVLNTTASNNKEITDTEIALTKLNAIRQGKSEFFQNQVIGQTLNTQASADVALPKYEESELFEKKFSTPKGIAQFRFGDKINIARDNLIQDLKAMGHNNVQVSVSDSNDNTIFYSVSLDYGKVAFTVPIKTNKQSISKPSVLLCNGTVSAFCKESINDMYVSNQTDYKAAAVASPLFDLKPSELINNIREAVEDGQNEKAEDALNVLANSNDEKAYAIGFKLYMDGLGAKKAEASQKCTCSMIIKNASSKHPICGHTGLPLHKVYQDKDGNCRPLYRRGMEETYEAATFMNAKIFG